MLLDVIAPLIIEPWKVVLFMTFAISLEAVVLVLFRYRKFTGVLIDSLLINIVSFLAGMVLQVLEIVESIKHIDRPGELVVLLSITVIIEGIILYLRNRKASWTRLLFAVIVVNLCSYGLFVLMFDPFGR